MPDALELLKSGFKLNTDQEGLIVRVGWAVLLSVHVLWVCGWLAWAGFAAPFANASDFAMLQAAAYTSARVAIANEIRGQVQLCKSVPDIQTKMAIASQIDRLQEEYKKFSNGQKYDAGACP